MQADANSSDFANFVCVDYLILIMAIPPGLMCY